MTSEPVAIDFPYDLPLWVCVNHQDEGELCDIHDLIAFVLHGERHLPLFTSLKAAERFAEEAIAGRPLKITRPLTLLDVLERCRLDGCYLIAVNPTASTPTATCESRHRTVAVIGLVVSAAGLRRVE